jgi:hypothetical protein
MTDAWARAWHVLPARPLVPLPKDLTDAGKYYKEHNSLDGYTEKK